MAAAAVSASRPFDFDLVNGCCCCCSCPKLGCLRKLCCCLYGCCLAGLSLPAPICCCGMGSAKDSLHRHGQCGWHHMSQSADIARLMSSNMRWTREYAGALTPRLGQLPQDRGCFGHLLRHTDWDSAGLDRFTMPYAADQLLDTYRYASLLMKLYIDCKTSPAASPSALITASICCWSIGMPLFCSMCSNAP